MTRLVLFDFFCNKLTTVWAPTKKLLISWQFSGPYGVTKYDSGWRKDVVNQCLEFGRYHETAQLTFMLDLRHDNGIYIYMFSYTFLTSQPLLTWWYFNERDGGCHWLLYGTCVTVCVCVCLTVCVCVCVCVCDEMSLSSFNCLCWRGSGLFTEPGQSLPEYENGAP